ncbi:MAG: enoyl-CoA hydratase-related protein, partial [Legionellaceae bacterium]
EALMARACDLLRGLIALAPLALSSIMSVIDHGYDLSLTDALHLEAVHFSKLCASEDKQEGVSAFLEKRKAQFKGH